MDSNRSFFFIAVNFNNSEYTIEYIKSVLSLNYQKKSIVIVDNNSKKKDVKNLVTFCDKIENTTLIMNEENVGYFKALNIGIKAIVRQKDDYVVVGNNDLVFRDDFVSKINDYDPDSNTLVIAPNIVRLDGIHQNPHFIYKYNKWHRFYRELYYQNYYMSIVIQRLYNIVKKFIYPQNRAQPKSPIEIFSGYGACYILTPQFFAHFELLDAPLFLMWEEAFLTNQVKGVNGKIIYLPSAIVDHHDHTSISKISEKKMFNYTKEGYIYFKEKCIHANK
jgi:GT2 family glycosyltransferase